MTERCLLVTFESMKKQTHKNIADKVGVSRAFITQLVNTEKRPNWRRAKQLAEATGVNPVIWLEGTSEEIKSAIKK